MKVPYLLKDFAEGIQVGVVMAEDFLVCPILMPISSMNI